MRISKRDTMTEILINLSDGNPGAIYAISSLNEYLYDRYLPHTLLYYLQILDLVGIYGSGIYILYNDKCSNSAKDFAKLLISADKKVISNGYLSDLSKDKLSELNISDEQLKKIRESVLPISNVDNDDDRFVLPY